MNLISIGKFSEMTGISIITLRRLHKDKKLIPIYVSSGGTRYYSPDQAKFFNNEIPHESKNVIGYCRVSTIGQKDDLENQVKNVQAYMCAKGYNFEIITDIGSGINYNKKGLKDLLKKINDHQVSKVVILYKDRLIRFGYELIEYLCELNDVELEVVDTTECSKEKELTDDLIQIITVFANRLYGQRSKKTKKLINEVLNNENCGEDSIKTDS